MAKAARTDRLDQELSPQKANLLRHAYHLIGLRGVHDVSLDDIAAEAAVSKGSSTGEVVYSGAKGAVIAFTKGLAREVARHGITVNCVAPGLTDTPLLAGISEGAEKLMSAIVRSIPLGRVGKPEEVARAILFFASPDADYITGQTLSVNGGLTMI